MTEQEIRRKMANYTFYHTIRLTDTLETSGWASVRPLTTLVCQCIRAVNLKGKRVLDIGCRDGLMSFEAERCGASELIGIDSDVSKAAVEFLIPVLKSKLQIHKLNVLDLRPETYGLFDVIVFAGVLYHLRYPFWVLKLVRDVLKPDGILILETAIRVDANKDAVLYCPIGKESPYEPTSCTFFNRKGIVDTLQSLGLETQEIDSLNEHNRVENHPIDRIVLTARHNAAVMDRSVASYWDGTHETHTAVAEAMQKLAATDAVKAQVVKLRYFEGLTGDQAAKVLGISPTAGERQWEEAKAWIAAEVAGR